MWNPGVVAACMTIDELVHLATSDMGDEVAAEWVAGPNLVLYASRAQTEPVCQSTGMGYRLYDLLVVAD